MSLVTIKSIPAFDADIGTIIEFTVMNAAAQVYGNKLTIYNNNDNSIVYTESDIYSSMLYKRAITPEMNLINGKAYNIAVTVYDINGNEIGRSSTNQLFYCYTNPVFKLNINEGQIINASSIQVILNYTQIEGEELYESVLRLYNSAKNLIYTSDTLYDITNPVTLSGLHENLYYIQATGITKYNTSLDTGLIEFSIAYTTPSPTVILEVKNLYDEAAIQIRSNIHAILYDVGFPENVFYIDDKEVNLWDNWVDHNRGYKIDGDYCVIQKVRACQDNRIILTLFGSVDYQQASVRFRTHDTYGVEKTVTDPYGRTLIDEEGNVITLSKGNTYIDWDEVNNRDCFWELDVKSPYNNYVSSTNKINYPLESDNKYNDFIKEYFHVCVVRIGDLYNLTVIREKEMAVI